MSEEKTEAPTPRRRKKAREEGQIARSPELAGAAILLGMAAAGRSTMETQTQNMSSLFERHLTLVRPDLTDNKLIELSGSALQQAALASAPAMGVALGVGVAVNIAQVGLFFTPKLLEPKPSRMNPLQGLQRLFSPRGAVEILKGMAKLGVVGGVGWDYVSKRWESIGLLAATSPSQVSKQIGQMTYELGMKMVGTLAVIAVLDYAWQRYQHEKSLKMTRQEIKDELRDSDGNPEIRQRIRQRQREMSRRRMMAEVPGASVVIMNPTHYAVALKYELGQVGAPRIVAKGRDLIALKIRDLAKENNVPVVENPPLARALHAGAEIGQEVPGELFRAVAEVLALIWRLDSAAARRAR